LIRIYPASSAAELERELDGALGAVHERESRAALGGIMRAVVAVRDLDAAVAIYRDGLGLTASAPTVDRAAGMRSVVCRAPAGAAIELATALDASQPVAAELADSLEQSGEGLFALVLDSVDPAASERAFRASGVALRRLAGELPTWQLPRDASFGARVWIRGAG
jgi:hypothetical protein